MRRAHWTTIAGSVAGGVLALGTVGPVAVAVLLLRCCDDSTGPTAGAWIVIGCAVAAVTLTGAAVGGLAARVLRRVFFRRS